MASEVKYVNVALNAYSETAIYVCELENIKKGDFVVVPAMSGEVTGRVMSLAPKKVFSLSLARTKKVIRKASPQEINEVADLFGIAKNPEFATDEEEDSFLTNSGYGTKELNKMVKKYQEKQVAKEAKVAGDNNEVKIEKAEDAKQVAKLAASKLQEKLDEMEKAEQKENPKLNSFMKEDDAIPGYWRYVAIGILALYFLKDYLFE